MTTGAFWMVSVRFLERNLGLISTLILARILVPEDFGLVAMATVFFHFLKLFSEFGLQDTLIRFQDADRSYYDTAWTLNLLLRWLVAAVLVATAPLLGDFFDEPRVVPIVYVLAFVAVLEGLRNIAIVDFLKKFDFRKHFVYSLSKKLVAFIVTVTIALMYQSYWALVWGNVAGAVASVLLSYMMLRYRPWFALSRMKEIFGFSSWLLLNNVVQYVGKRGVDLIIGRMAGPAAMGVYRIGMEISNLPTSEVKAPLMRTFFPGFASIAHDRSRLCRVFLDSQAVIATITVPAGMGIVFLAEPIVLVLLGSNWTAAIPLVQVLALYGVGLVVYGTRSAFFMAVGKPHLISVLTCIQIVTTLPLLAWLLHIGYALEVAVWAKVVGSAAAAPLGIYLVLMLLDTTLWSFLRILVRPAAGTAAMALVLWVLDFGEVETTWHAVQILLIAVPAGALTYTVTVVSLWFLAGRPAGAESRLLEMIAPPVTRLISRGNLSKPQ